MNTNQQNNIPTPTVRFFSIQGALNHWKERQKYPTDNSVYIDLRTNSIITFINKKGRE